MAQLASTRETEKKPGREYMVILSMPGLFVTAALEAAFLRGSSELL